MKIKKVEPSGIKRGQPVELSPKEKAVEAVKDGVVAQAPTGYLCYAENITVLGVDVSSKGPRDDNKSFAHNSYTAKGHVHVRKLKTDTDDLFPAKPHHFEVKFEDVLDGWGMPDIKINEFNLE